MEFTKKFSDEEVCKDYFLGVRWPDGIISCPLCGNNEKRIGLLNGWGVFKCYSCLRQFSHLKNTLFENTKIPLSTWFFLIYVTAMNKKTTSSVQMAKNMGLTQNTTWYLMQGIRQLCAEKNKIRLRGIVEIDECFIGGGSKWSRWGSLSTRKQPILGMVERGGMVVIKTIPERSVERLEELIAEYVENGSTIYTDGWIGYKNVSFNYNHEWLDHASREYVRGDVHTNTIESVWRILKTGIRNGHHWISAKHVQAYLDEVAYRYNYKHLRAMERFNDLLTRSVGLPSIIETGKIIQMNKVA